MARVLVASGATELSAMCAAVVLERGAAIREAWDEIEVAAEPAAFDAALLASGVSRARELVLVGSCS
jgi:hypothetical protein